MRSAGRLMAVDLSFIRVLVRRTMSGCNAPVCQTKPLPEVSPGGDNRASRRGGALPRKIVPQYLFHPVRIDRLGQVLVKASRLGTGDGGVGRGLQQPLQRLVTAVRCRERPAATMRRAYPRHSLLEGIQPAVRIVYGRPHDSVARAQREQVLLRGRVVVEDEGGRS